MVLSHCVFVSLAISQTCRAAVWSLRGHEGQGTLIALDPAVAAADADNSSAASNPQVDKLKNDAERTYRKAVTMHPAKMLRGDIDLMASYLLPGPRPDFRKKELEFLVALVAILWLIPFKAFFYVNDQEQEKELLQKEGEQDIEKKSMEDAVESDPWARCWRKCIGQAEEVEAPEPDLVIVCYNPGCKKYADSQTNLPKGALKKTLGDKFYKMTKKVMSEGVKQAEVEAMRRLRNLLHLKSRSSSQALMSKASHILESVVGKSEEDSGEDEADKQTYEAVRTAFIQDLYEILPRHGFSATIFNSVDRDELFLCVSLKNETACRHFMTRNGTKLQLRPEVVAELKVKQDPADINSSPPYVRYDENLVNTILAGDSKDTDFYQNFPLSGSQTIMNSAERFRACYKYINTTINLDRAAQNKFIVGWFPAHGRDGLVKLRKSWASWGLLTDFTFAQPLNLLNDYFGSRFAFLFAWNGCYCKLLLALVPIAIVFEVANAVAIFYGRNEMWNRRSLIGFALVVAVWTRVSSNTWQRQQQYLVSQWDLKHVLKDATQRPEFFGEEEESPIDGNERVKKYPKWKFQLRQTISWLATIAFCVVDFFCVIMWIDEFQGRLTPAASIALAIIIQIFTQIFNVMVEAMTIMENHQFQLTYYNSYLLKMFVFQFVNQYSAFFYISVKQQFTAAGCPKIDVYDNDCVGLLNEQLPMTLLILTFTRVVQVVVATLMVKLKIWRENREMRQNNEEVVPISFLEEQGKFGPFRVREQIEATVQLGLTLGYVLIFGSVAPRIVLLSLIVFMVQLRAGAVLVTTAATRTLPRKAGGIGPLKDAVNVLAVVGVIFSGYLLVNFGPLFKGTMILTRVSGLILWVVCVLALWFMVDFVFSPNSESVDILDARRAHVKKKLTERNSDVMYGDGRKGSEKRLTIVEEGEAAYADEVQNGTWDAIPTLWDLHVNASADTRKL